MLHECLYRVVHTLTNAIELVSNCAEHSIPVVPLVNVLTFRLVTQHHHAAFTTSANY